MGVFDFFKNKKDVGQKAESSKKSEPAGKSEQELAAEKIWAAKQVFDLINDKNASGEYIVSVAALKGVDLNSDNGKGITYLSMALENALSGVNDRLVKSHAFLSKNAELDKAAKLIEEKRVRIKNPKHYFAAALFSHENFLNSLGIPKNEHPQFTTRNTMFVQKNADKKDLEYDPKELTAKLKKAQFLYRDQKQKNLVDEKEDKQYAELQNVYKAFAKDDNDITKAKERIAYYDLYEKDSSTQLTASEFITLVQDPDILESFPWVNNYKPDEEEFKSSFSGIVISSRDRFRDRFTAKLNKLKEEPPLPKEDDDDGVEMEMTHRLRQCGYYSWQKERLTKEKEETLEKRDEMNRQWQIHLEIENQERIRQHTIDRGRDRGFSRGR